MDGFTHGFSIGFCGAEAEIISDNLASAKKLPLILENKLFKELALGRVAGPFASPPFDSFRVSPLGLVEKSTPGEYRIIHNLSHPEGVSVNDGIPKECSEVKYACIQDAVVYIKKLLAKSDVTSLGKSVFLAKCDIKSAFRIIPISPSEYHLLGFKWGKFFYYDKVLPMGCSSSCRIFERVSTALEWIAVNKLGISGVIHYLDDFLFIAESESEAQIFLARFQLACSKIGIPLAPEKTRGPSQQLPFLGITIDTVLEHCRLPVDKVQKCRALLDSFLDRTKVTLFEVQSLVGLLNFACTVVLPGRAFLRRSIDLSRGISQPYHHLRLTKGAKDDLRVWKDFLDDYNGVSFFHDDKWLSSDFLRLFTDASGALGFGAIFGSAWFYGEWPRKWKYQNIAILELYPIVAAVFVWGAGWAGKNVLFLSDNQAVVEVINKQSCKNPILMALLRILVLRCLKLDIVFRARHVPGKDNGLADVLSRLQVAKFHEAAPWADAESTLVPPEISPLGLQLL